MIVCLWNREIQHIEGLNISDLFEHGNQFREVKEFAEPSFRPIPCTLRSQLDGGNGFTKGRGPCVEVEQIIFEQGVVLQVFLHGVHFNHGIGDWCPGGEDDTVPSGDLIQVTAL